VASIDTNNLKTGKKSYTVRWRDSLNDDQQETFPKKVQATQFRNKIEASLDTGTYIDPRAGNILLRDHLTTWQSHRHHLRPSTTARDDSYIKNHIVPELGDYRLDRLSRSIIKAWVKGRVTAGYAPATVRKAAGILSTALDDAVEDRLIAVNPAQKLDLPKIETQEMRFLTPDEVWRLADTIDRRYRALVVTGAFTGLRPGELRALRLEHVNMLGRTIQVEETLTEVSGHIHAGPVKTAASRRQVKIPKLLVDELAHHLAMWPPTGDGFLFTAPNGGPIRKDNFRLRTWLPAVAAAGLGGVRVHDLRHTHAALLIAQGEHPKVIQSRLGHKSIRTTLDLYGHLFKGIDEAAADGLDHAYSRSTVGF
jgi:integrase